ncbi:MAG: DUF1801 domain-containing protein [Anaerolineales bacterium]
MNSKKSFSSMDEYIATFPPDVQKVLEELRNTIRVAAPDAKETISYNMPTFTLNGTYLIYFAGWKKHVSVYPIPAGSEAFNKKIAKYADEKSTVKFPLDKPIPFNLITQMVKLQAASNLKKTSYRIKGDKK